MPYREDKVILKCRGWSQGEASYGSKRSKSSRYRGSWASFLLIKYKVWERFTRSNKSHWRSWAIICKAKPWPLEPSSFS